MRSPSALSLSSGEKKPLISNFHCTNCTVMKEAKTYVTGNAIILSLSSHVVTASLSPHRKQKIWRRRVSFRPCSNVQCKVSYTMPPRVFLSHTLLVYTNLANAKEHWDACTLSCKRASSQSSCKWTCCCKCGQYLPSSYGCLLTCGHTKTSSSGHACPLSRKVCHAKQNIHSGKPSRTPGGSRKQPSLSLIHI